MLVPPRAKMFPQNVGQHCKVLPLKAMYHLCPTLTTVGKPRIRVLIVDIIQHPCQEHFCDEHLLAYSFSANNDMVLRDMKSCAPYLMAHQARNGGPIAVLRPPVQTHQRPGPAKTPCGILRPVA